MGLIFSINELKQNIRKAKNDGLTTLIFSPKEGCNSNVSEALLIDNSVLKINESNVYFIYVDLTKVSSQKRGYTAQYTRESFLNVDGSYNTQLRASMTICYCRQFWPCYGEVCLSSDCEFLATAE